MASEDIGSLVVRIEAKMDQFIGSASKAEGALSKIGKAALGLGAVLGVGKIFKSFISEAAEAEEGQAQLNAVLASTKGKAGITADAVNGLANKFSMLTKFTDDQIISAESMLLTFTNIGKDVFPNATKTVLDMSQALGQDLKSSSVQLGKALNDPIAGISALSRVGVTFTEGQKEVIAKLVETGDVAGAQKLILQELQTEFGGSAEAAGNTFAGQLAILSHALDNVKEDIGMRLMPVLQGMVSKIQEHMPQIQAFIDNALTKMGEAVKVVSDRVQDWTKFFQEHWNIVKPILEGVALSVITYKTVAGAIALIEIATKAWAAAQWLLNFALTANPIGIMITMLAGLGVLLYEIIKRSDDLKLALVNTWQAVKNAVIPIIVSIENTFKGMINGIVDGINWISSQINRLGFNIPTIDKLYYAPTKSPLESGMVSSHGPKFEMLPSHIPGLARGTNFIPFDTLAFLHKGEGVIPAAQNPANPGASAPAVMDNKQLARDIARELAAVLQASPLQAVTVLDGQRVSKQLWPSLVSEKQRLGVATL